MLDERLFVDAGPCRLRSGPLVFVESRTVSGDEKVEDG